MNKLNALVVMGFLFLVSSAFADGRPYGAAGCGLGNLAMGKHGSQVLAATTNGTSGSQTFGITSGTSNCVDSQNMASRKQLPMFIEANRVALANDMARGQGETLAHVSHVYNCQDNVKFNAVMQKNFSTVFPKQDVDGYTVNQSIISVIKSDNALASSCKI